LRSGDTGTETGIILNPFRVLDVAAETVLVDKKSSIPGAA
jgi:hypothetical protein